MISGSLFFYQNWLTFLLALWLSFLLTKAYMNAAANKFLRIYYARVKEVLIDAEASA